MSDKRNVNSGIALTDSNVFIKANPKHHTQKLKIFSYKNIESFYILRDKNNHSIHINGNRVTSFYFGSDHPVKLDQEILLFYKILQYTLEFYGERIKFIIVHKSSLLQNKDQYNEYADLIKSTKRRGRINNIIIASCVVLFAVLFIIFAPDIMDSIFGNDDYCNR